MCPERERPGDLTKAVKRLHRASTSHDERLTEVGQPAPQLRQTGPHKPPVRPGEIFRSDDLRLHDVKRQDRPPLGRARQRPMIVDPQVPFEPDDLQIWNRMRRSHSYLSLATVIIKRQPSYFECPRTCARTSGRNDTFRFACDVSRIQRSPSAALLRLMDRDEKTGRRSPRPSPRFVSYRTQLPFRLRRRRTGRPAPRSHRRLGFLPGSRIDPPRSGRPVGRMGGSGGTPFQDPSASPEKHLHRQRGRS